MRPCILTAALVVVLLAPITQAQPTLTRIDVGTILHPKSLVCVDLDNDGDLDLATLSHGDADDYLAVHLNRGDGTFLNPVYTLVDSVTQGGMNDLASGDLNQDGNADLVANSYSNARLTIFYGAGDGTFADTLVLHSQNVLSIVVADFTNDGWLDIGVTHTNGPIFIGVRQSANSGTQFLPPIYYPAGEHAYGLQTADLNNDGWQDVVVSNWQDARFSVLLGDTAGGLLPYTQYSLPNWSYGIAIANLVGSAALDLAVTVTNYQGSTGSPFTQIRIYEGAGDGTFSLVDSTTAGNNPLGIAAAQIVGDAALDLLWVCGDDNILQISHNGGVLGFASPVDFPTATEPFELVIADLDGTGKNDVVVSARGTNLLSIFQNEGPIVCTDADFDGFGDPGHPENECADDNCPLVFNPDQADWDNNGVGDACTPTDTGSNVTVQTSASTVLVFDSVSAGGTTGTTLSQSGPTPPVNFGVVPLGTPQFLNIFTSVAFAGQITITVSYNPADLVGPEDSLQLLHYTGGQWLDITVTRDTAANTITGTATSLSPFALVEQCCRTSIRGNVDCSHEGSIDISDLTRLVDYMFISFQPLCCSGQANVDGSPDGSADISDLTALIDYLYINFIPPVECN